MNHAAESVYAMNMEQYQMIPPTAAARFDFGGIYIWKMRGFRFFCSYPAIFCFHKL